MKKYYLEIETPNGEKRTFPLDELITERHLLMIGRSCDEVYNTIPVDDASVDPFQCCIQVEEEGQYTHLYLLEGQVRTECGKGLRSSYEIPCKHCHGRCMGLHPGMAIHYHRKPLSHTLLNGQPIEADRLELHDGDIIQIGQTKVVTICRNLPSEDAGSNVLSAPHQHWNHEG